jgi:hypothetical protein
MDNNAHKTAITKRFADQLLVMAEEFRKAAAVPELAQHAKQHLEQAEKLTADANTIYASLGHK